MQELLELVTKANIYVNSTSAPYVPVLEKVAAYITRLFRIFGLAEENTTLGFGGSAGSAVSGGNVCVDIGIADSRPFVCIETNAFVHFIGQGHSDAISPCTIAVPRQRP